MRFFEKEGAGTLEKAPGIYRPEFKQGVPTDSLIRYLVEENGYNIPFYAGYWHGYLVVLKLLLVTDYIGICGINRIVQTVVVVVAALILWRKLSIRYAVPVLAVYLFWRTQTMAVFYRKMAVGNRLLYFFLLGGIVTNYIDFLTYPIATLGIPLTLWLCFKRERTCTDQGKGIIAYSIC